MARDLKKFMGGGMDTDSGADSVAANDWVRSYNVRITGTQEGELGDITSMESTTLIQGATRPSGINSGLGADRFETVRKAYAIIYNSQGFHQIVELDYDTMTESVVFENKTDSNGVDIFQLNPRMFFNDIRLVQDKYLILSDSFGEVYYINVDSLKNNKYPYVTSEDITLVQGQSIKEPTAVYNSDAGRSVNSLKNRLFQFRTLFEKDAFRSTTWSTISKRVVPINEPTPTIGTDVTKDNNLIVSVDAGTDRVVRINVASRYDMLDWFVIKSIDRKTVVALPNTTVDVSQEIYEAYDPATNIYSFAFYNDGLYNNINVLETDQDYDHVPRKAGALEDVNGSLIVLGDITEGYERPVMDVSLSVSAYDPQISYTPPAGNPMVVVYTENREVFVGNSRNYRRVRIVFNGLPKIGDKIFVNLRDVRNWANTMNYSYTVTSATQDNLYATISAFAPLIPNCVVQSGLAPGEWSLYFLTSQYFELGSAVVDLQNAGTGASKSVNSLKSNSSYQLAFTHFDRFGRYFPIVSDERFVIKTPSYAQSNGLVPQINWNIASKPPKDAVSAQWLISLNNTHETDLYLTGKYDSAKSEGDYLVFNVSSLKKFNEVNSSSILNYEYSAGDRVTFQFTYSGSSTPIKWFNTPSIDVEVVGFEIVTDTSTTPETTSFFLKVRKSSALNITDIDTENVMLEVYSPKKRVITTGTTTSLATTLFYEFGERIEIANGDYVQKSGIIRDGDTYFKTRAIENSTTQDVYVFTVESFDFSDFYKSNYTSYGRPRIYDDEQGESRKRASMRWSQKFVTGSRVNGLNRFFGENIYGEGDGETSSSHGAIGKLKMVRNYLVCLQETQVGHIPVNISIVEDQVSQAQVAISERIFNYIRYISEYGIGTAKESFSMSQNGNIYFVDPNNSLPIRDAQNGVQVIANKNIKHFRKVLKQAQKDGRKIIGYYDDYNDEWNISIEVKSNIVENFVFDNVNWLLMDGYVIDPSTIVINSQNNGTVEVDEETGIATFTPADGFFGNAGFNFSFLDGEVTVTKNVCISVVQGELNISPFFFIDMLDVEVSTVFVSNSVLITGNNIAVPIGISLGGEYRINNGAWTNVDGTVNEGDVVEVRQTSSLDYEETTSVVLTVSQYSDSFDVTTKEELVPTEDIIATLNGYKVEDESNATYGFTLSLPQSIISTISVTFSCNYNGGTYGGTIILNGGTTVTDTGIVITNGTLGGNITSLIRTGGSPPEGSVVTLTIGGTKTLAYDITF